MVCNTGTFPTTSQLLTSLTRLVSSPLLCPHPYCGHSCLGLDNFIQHLYSHDISVNSIDNNVNSIDNIEQVIKDLEDIVDKKIDFKNDPDTTVISAELSLAESQLVPGVSFSPMTTQATELIAQPHHQWPGTPHLSHNQENWNNCSPDMRMFEVSPPCQAPPPPYQFPDHGYQSSDGCVSNVSSNGQVRSPGSNQHLKGTQLLNSHQL